MSTIGQKVFFSLNASGALVLSTVNQLAQTSPTKIDNLLLGTTTLDNSNLTNSSLTGTSTAPTAPVTDASTNIANTYYVTRAINNFKTDGFDISGNKLIVNTSGIHLQQGLQTFDMNANGVTINPSALKISSFGAGLVHSNGSGQLTSSALSVSDIADGLITNVKLSGTSVAPVENTIALRDTSGYLFSLTVDSADTSTKVATTEYVSTKLSTFNSSPASLPTQTTLTTLATDYTNALQVSTYPNYNTNTPLSTDSAIKYHAASKNGQYILIGTDASGVLPQISSDSGVTFTNVTIQQAWNNSAPVTPVGTLISMAVSQSGKFQIIAYKNGLLFFSRDFGVTFVVVNVSASTNYTRKWSCVSICEYTALLNGNVSFLKILAVESENTGNDIWIYNFNIDNNPTYSIIGVNGLSSNIGLEANQHGFQYSSGDTVAGNWGQGWNSCVISDDGLSMFIGANATIGSKYGLMRYGYGGNGKWNRFNLFPSLSQGGSQYDGNIRYTITSISCDSTGTKVLATGFNQWDNTAKYIFNITWNTDVIDLHGTSVDFQNPTQDLYSSKMSLDGSYKLLGRVETTPQPNSLSYSLTNPVTSWIAATFPAANIYSISYCEKTVNTVLTKFFYISVDGNIYKIDIITSSHPAQVLPTTGVIDGSVLYNLATNKFTIYFNGVWY